MKLGDEYGDRDWAQFGAQSKRDTLSRDEAIFVPLGQSATIVPSGKRTAAFGRSFSALESTSSRSLLTEPANGITRK